MKVTWRGVFPAITTQFHNDFSLNLEGTARHLEKMIDAGIHGVVLLGTVGENTALEYQEKLTVVKEMLRVINGLMVLPGMVYKSDERESVQHFRTIARSTGLPIMIYNNPVSYGVDVPPEAFKELADEANIVAIKESSENVRRITDLHNTVGGRYILFAGVDDLVLESMLLGVEGWIS